MDIIRIDTRIKLNNTEKLKWIATLRKNCDTQNKNDIQFFIKTKKRITHNLLDKLKKKIKSLKDDDLRSEYPFSNLRELKLSCTIARNNVKMCLEDGFNDSWYKKELERATRKLKEYEGEWLTAIKAPL